MAEVAVNFVSQKISKIKFRPLNDLRWIEEDKDSNNFATGSWDDTKHKICLWNCFQKESSTESIDGEESDPNIESELNLISEHSHVGDVTDLQFLSSDLLVSSSCQGSVNLFKIQNENLISMESWTEIHSFNQRNAPCTALAVRNTDIISVGEDGKIALININRKDCDWINEADSCAITSVSMVGPSEILVGSFKGQLTLWDIKSKPEKSSRTFSQSGNPASVTCLARYPTQAHIFASGDEEGMLSIWDLRQEKYPVSIVNGHANSITEMKFDNTNPDLLYTCSNDGGCWLWDATNLGRGNIKQGNESLGKQRVSSALSNSWMKCDAMKHRLEVVSFLPDQTMPVNCLDVRESTLICGNDNEAIFIITGIKNR